MNFSAARMVGARDTAAHSTHSTRSAHLLRGVWALVLTIALVAVPQLAARADVLSTFVQQGMTFTVTSAPGQTPATVAVTGYEYGAPTDVTIPSSVSEDGIEYTVTHIENWAFTQKGLTSVVLPDTITRIGEWAFYMNQLTSVTLPSSLVALGSYAFSDNQLSSVALPTQLTYIPPSAFGWNNLTSVTIPEGVTAIGNFAFIQNPLTSLSLPASLNTIEEWAFANTDLTHLTIPAGVTRIDQGAFAKAPAFPEPHQLRHVFFDGPATTIRAFDAWGSFGDNSNLTVHYLAEHAASFDPASTGVWNGYATRERVSETVSFDTQGGGAIDSVTTLTGTTVDPLPTPVKPHHTFAGWNLAGDGSVPFTTATPVVGNTTVYAQWIADTYVVTLQSETGSTTQHVRANDTATRPADPAREGFTFDGWRVGLAMGEPYDFGTAVLGDVTLVAAWTAIAPAPAPEPAPVPAPAAGGAADADAAAGGAADSERAHPSDQAALAATGGDAELRAGLLAGGVVLMLAAVGVLRARHRLRSAQPHALPVR